jgi:DNA-binding NtrC family response regulator
MATPSPPPDLGRQSPVHGGAELSAFDSILGESDAAAEMRAFGARAAAVEATVLLTGESGTGKGLLARAIHAESARTKNGIVAVNCAGVPETLFETEFFGHTRGAFTGAHQAHRGLLEQAHGGTLFLDEIGELAPPLQAKLLTAVEDREFRRVGGERTLRVDIRVIAATSADLEAAVEDGRFRRDLYHRLLVLSYRLPPLRERGPDTEGFANRFLAAFAARYGRPVRGFDECALHRIRTHPWPGNVRQLANAVEAAVLACDGPRIGLRHLPQVLLDGHSARGSSRPAPDSHTALHSAGTPAAPPTRTRYVHYGDPLDERRRIQQALQRWRGNKTRAAVELGMARNTLRARLRALGLEDAAP